MDKEQISIREYLEHLVKEMREHFEGLYQEHIREHQKDSSALETRLKEHQASHDREHTMNDQAIKKSDEKMDIRLAGMNEWRDSVTDLTNRFARADAMDTAIHSLTEKIDKLEDTVIARIEASNAENNRRISLLERAQSNLEGRLWAVGAGLALITVAINVALHFVK